MSLSAGSVYAILGGKFQPSGFAQFDAALKRSAAEAGATEKAIAGSSKRSGQSMSAMATVANKGAAVGLVAVGTAAVYSVKKAMDFQKAMSEVQAVTKANSRDFKRLGDSAKDLGAKTGVGATAAAGALAELAKGGLSTEQTIGALNGTIAMSQAGGMNLSDAATTVAQALNLFNLNGAEASHVADAFATAANKTTADVSFFSQGLAQGGAAAKAVGLNFDETTAALETLAANGFKSGSDAGTSLKTAFTQLAHPTKQARDETKKLGLEFFKQNGEMKSLSSISSMLRDKMGGLTRQQRLAASATLVGQDGMRALLALYDQGPKKVQRFQSGLKEQGSAQDVARTKMDNLAGDWKKFQANLETAGINIGTKLIPKLRDLTQGISDFTQQFDKGEPGTGGGTFRWLTDHLNDLGPTLPGMIRDVTDQWQYLQDAISNWHPPKVDLTPKFARGALPDLRSLKASDKASAMVMKIIADDSSPRQKLAALRAMKIPDKTARFILQSGGIDGAIARIVARLAGVKNPPPIVVRVKDEASRILNNIINKPLRDMVAKILADDSSVQDKVAALQGLGISGPTANFLANTAGITDARDKINGEHLSVPVKYVPNVLKPTLPGGLRVPYTVFPVKGSASGRGPGAREASLVGEGGGPEHIGNPAKGWRTVTRPTLMGLAADDYVIPTESRYRGRALSLMAHALGIPAFKKGRHPKAIHSNPIQYAEYLGPLEAEKQKWQDRVDRDQQAKNDKASKGKRKGKLTDKAKKARRDLPHELEMLRRAKRELKSATDYGKRIEKQEDLANIYADDMNLATTETSWKAARFRRTGALDREAKLLRDALKLAGGPAATSAWARALRKKLGEAENGIKDANEESFDAGTFNTDEQLALDKVDADIALAQLTDTKADDIGSLTAKERLLTPLLAKAQRAGRSGAVAEIAGLLKQTRDELADAQKPPDLTADQQLTTDQAFQKGLAQGRGAFIDRVTDRAFGGGPQIIVNTLHPGDPRTVRAIGDAAAAGFGYQQPRQSSTARVGV